jgi:hypothetical protein
MSSGNSYNGKVCYHWLRIYNNPPSLFGFSLTMYYDITKLNTELASNDYLFIYLSIKSIHRSFSIRPRRSILINPSMHPYALITFFISSFISFAYLSYHSSYHPLGSSFVPSSSFTRFIIIIYSYSQIPA